MARILFISMPFSAGHINPFIPVVHALRSGGHDVGWLPLLRPFGSYETQVRASGAMPLSPARFPDLPKPQATSTQADFMAMMRGAFIDSVPDQLGPVGDVIAGFAADVVAADALCYAGFIAAEKAGIPSASVHCGHGALVPESFTSTWDYANDVVRSLVPLQAELFARYSMSSSWRLNDYLSPRLNIAFTTEAYLGSETALPPKTELVGPSIPSGDRGDEPNAFPWDRLSKDKPIVYMAFGSTESGAEELYAIVASACSRLGAQLVLSTGPAASADEVARGLGGDVIALPYAPQLQILERASAFISHGGANSVMEAMYAGVPTLVIPLRLDQPIQAYFVGKSGAGTSLDRPTVDVETCTSALARLLDSDGDYRANARRIRDSFRGRDGGKLAAEKLVALASSS